MIVSFDTLAAAEALQDAGIEPEKARAIVATTRDAAGAGRDSLATKADIADIRTELSSLETRLTWRMIGIVAAQGTLIVALLKLPVL